MFDTVAPPTTTTDTAPPVTWVTVDRGLVVGSRPGEYVGSIEHAPIGHVAIDGAGNVVGRFDSLAQAKRALVSPPRSPRNEQEPAWHRTAQRVAAATGLLSASLAVAAVVITAV
ncbi:hypothetical protein ACIGCK_01710 [Microbacterium sp. NPDC078428]|uniref:Uncharacterized protein n=1 Tax=Microbacterium limosum TaxID=3079935 RepID=A0AAU0MH95_9MICO|nr:hypothetical protein [Microbacterium sp. Y20]WOQ69980.1 hypothetical protein RYJ27_01730 [Microbacterium sp. Y20]